MKIFNTLFKKYRFDFENALKKEREQIKKNKKLTKEEQATLIEEAKTRLENNKNKFLEEAIKIFPKETQTYIRKVLKDYNVV
jgi:F0F1-type ATP synthase membrane subunit b/b'